MLSDSIRAGWLSAVHRWRYGEDDSSSVEPICHLRLYLGHAWADHQEVGVPPPAIYQQDLPLPQP